MHSISEMVDRPFRGTLPPTTQWTPKKMELQARCLFQHGIHNPIPNLPTYLPWVGTLAVFKTSSPISNDIFNEATAADIFALPPHSVLGLPLPQANLQGTLWTIGGFLARIGEFL